MGSGTEFWKDWWDESARKSTSDYSLNRGTDLRLTDLERRSELHLVATVDPQPSDVMLDAGCGSGRNLSIFSQKVHRIVGVDFSPHMLERARARVTDEHLSNVELRQASVTELPFADDSFEKVLCLSVLQYLDDEGCRLAFREMFRVSKNRARIIIHLKNGSSLYGLSKRCSYRLFTLLGRRSLPEHYRRLGVHERFIRECGGRVVEVDSFGMLTFVGLPRRFVAPLIRLESKLPGRRWLQRYGVNYKVTVAVTK
jgi:ubiquinone/menaquinone biosynthesis C-methylase UbiE